MAAKPQSQSKPAAPPGRRISQADLAQVRALQDEARRIERSLDPLKRLILTDLEAGVPVEAGPLRADVEVRSQQRLSRDNLMRALGAAQFEVVLAQIEPSVSRSLKVTLWV